ncbi:MAG: ABC transporter permease [Sarcina sp.]
MKSLYKLVFKNLKLNKRKTLIVLFTVILATILITAAGLIPLNIYKDYTAKTMEESGKYQLLINNLEETNLENIAKDGNITESGKSTLYGIKNNEKFSMFYYDEKAFELSPFSLLDGRLAKNEGEIVLDENYLITNNIEPKIDQVINLDYVDVAGNSIKKDFKLVGIASSTAQAKVKGIYYGFVSKKELASLNGENVLWTMYSNTVFTKLQDIEVYTGALEEIFDVNKDDISLNDLYISSGKIDWNLVLSAILVILIIVIATVMVIYNIFNISINERINEFGKLRAMGATKKNIKKMIFREGMIIALIAIPLGILLGWGITSFISYKFLFENISFSLVSELLIVGVAGIISFITILISLIKPANIAGRISPIEAVKYTDTKVICKKRKSERDINIFKLTKLNMLRHKKRSIITIASIMVSFILLVTIATIVESFNMDKAAKKYVSGDFVLTASRYFTEYKYDVFSEDFLKDLEALDDANEVNKIGLAPCSFENSGALSFNDSKNLGVQTIDSYILGYENKMLEELKQGLIAGAINVNGLDKNEIIVFRSEGDKRFNTNVGDEVVINVKNSTGEYIEKKFKVQAIVNNEYMEALDIIGLGEVFLSSKKTLDGIYGGDSTVKVQVNGEVQKINGYLDKNIQNNMLFTYQSQEETKEELKQEFLGIKLVAYALTIMILIISILNYMNTMAASVIARRKEFATLQAIGITVKGIKQILKIEGRLYVALGSLVGCGIGSVLGFFIAKILEKQAIFINYKYPFVIVGTVIVLIFLVQILTVKILSKKINKETVIERLKV